MINFIKNRENPVILDKENKFVYFPTNKVMQTTLARNILKDRVIVKKDNPKLWLEHFEKTDFNSIYKFGITRHPFGKFESAFNYLKSLNRTSKRMGISNMNINDYIKNIDYNINPYKLNPHFEYQYDSFYYKNELLVDELFKIETIQDNYKILFNKINCDKDLIQKNISSHNDTINDESKILLQKIYKKDMLLYK